jgi:hypothetical protein
MNRCPLYLCVLIRVLSPKRPRLQFNLETIPIFLGRGKSSEIVREKDDLIESSINTQMLHWLRSHLLTPPIYCCPPEKVSNSNKH